MAPPKGRGRGEDSTSPRRITAKQKQALAMRLRLAGTSYRLIAEELGYKDESGARVAIEAAMKATIQEPAEEYRAMHRMRLEELLRAAWPGALAGIPRSIEVANGLLNSIAKLDGLDAPKKIHDVTPFIDEAKALAAQLGISEEEAVAKAMEIIRSTATK